MYILLIQTNLHFTDADADSTIEDERSPIDSSGSLVKPNNDATATTFTETTNISTTANIDTLPINTDTNSNDTFNNASGYNTSSCNASSGNASSGNASSSTCNTNYNTNYNTSDYNASYNNHNSSYNVSNNTSTYKHNHQPQSQPQPLSQPPSQDQPQNQPQSHPQHQSQSSQTITLHTETGTIDLCTASEDEEDEDASDYIDDEPYYRDDCGKVIYINNSGPLECSVYVDEDCTSDTEPRPEFKTIQIVIKSEDVSRKANKYNTQNSTNNFIANNTTGINNHSNTNTNNTSKYTNIDNFMHFHQYYKPQNYSSQNQALDQMHNQFNQIQSFNQNAPFNQYNQSLAFNNQCTNSQCQCNINTSYYESCNESETYSDPEYYDQAPDYSEIKTSNTIGCQTSVETNVGITQTDEDHCRLMDRSTQTLTGGNNYMPSNSSLDSASSSSSSYCFYNRIDSLNGVISNSINKSIERTALLSISNSFERTPPPCYKPPPRYSSPKFLTVDASTNTEIQKMDQHQQTDASVVVV
ncbi:hypothetical protein Hz2V014 [Helicoverpa zea nudivirus 2]|uniref:Uncharacterized protein n=1 Tax=Helicoverpa zea nudivirus 2 TaxID=1128424 RepID=G9I040_HZNV2|nr:orf14 gene product [Helicoverpa zea nudivirus 2]AEW69563.1 hypothetical protein Hz2V014 [Helicoverpa zea nudivirus 2]